MEFTARRCAQLTDASSNPPPKLTVSAAVCTRNRAHLLRKCLEGLARLVPAPDEILVVDNSAGDEETRRAAAQVGARYTIEPAPGLSRARNRALAESSREIVAFLDDDAVPEPNWLEHLMKPFADPTVAAVNGRTREPDDRESTACDESLRRLTSRDPLWFEIVTFGGMGLGCNMALRRSACPQDGPFDERLGRGAPFQIGEESAALASLLSRGYAAVYTPFASVVHTTRHHGSLEAEATHSFAYWLFLFREFPHNRLDLLSFLLRRLRGKPLTWPRRPQEPGEILTSSWPIKLRAGLSGLLLFLRNL